MRLDRFITLNIVQPWRRVSSALFRRSGAARGWPVPVLMYHNIIDDPEHGVSPYFKVNTSPKVFAEHMQFLADHGYKTITISDLVSSLSSGSATVPPFPRTTDSRIHGSTPASVPDRPTVSPTHRSTEGRATSPRTPAQCEPCPATAGSDLRSPNSDPKLSALSPSPPKLVAITFDDGFSSVYTEAFPVLKKHGFTATVFLATAFIGDERREFIPAGSLRRSTVAPSNCPTNGRAGSPRTPAQCEPCPVTAGSAVVGRVTSHGASALDGPDPCPATAGSELRPLSRDCGIRTPTSGTAPVHGLTASTSDPAISAFSCLSRKSGDQLSAFPLSHSCLTWAEVRDMSDYGIEFGSHTVSHPKLVDLDWPEIIAELRNSRHGIEENLGKPVTSFCYPYAFPQADKTFVQRLKTELTKAGYSSCSTTGLGHVSNGDDLLELRRLPANSMDDNALVEAKLAGAYNWLRVPQQLVKAMKSRSSSCNGISRKPCMHDC